MFKKSIVLLFLSICIVASALNVYASAISIPVSDVLVDIDYSSNIVNLSCRTPSISGYYILTYDVTDPNGNVVCIGETKELDSNGKFETSFKLSHIPENETVYTLRIGGHYTMSEPYRFSVFGATARNNLLNELVSYSGDAFENKFKDIANVFSIDIADIENSSALFSKLCDMLEANKASLTVDNIKETARKNIIYCILKTNPEIVSTQLLEKYNDLLAVDIAIGSYYDQITDKQYIYNFISTKAEKFDDIPALFDEAVMVKSFTSLGRDKIFALINHYASRINSSYMSTYNNFSTFKKGEVAVALEQAAITSLEDIVNVFETAVKNNMSSSSSAVGGGGGSSGIGGSSGAGYNISPDVTTGNPKVEHMKFSDLDGYAWAVEGISYLFEKGIINGISQTEYNPAGLVTRGQLIKMLVIAFGVDEAINNYEFIDVSKDGWEYKYICSAYENNLVNGYYEGYFGVNDPVTRQDMATLIYRFAHKYGNVDIETTSEEFADNIQISDYATEAVYAMKNMGVLNGVGNNIFAPKDVCDRAMAAKAVYELIRKVY